VTDDERDAVLAQQAAAAAAQEPQEETAPEVPVGVHTLTPGLLEHSCQPEAEQSQAVVCWIWTHNEGGTWCLRVPVAPDAQACAFVRIAACPFCGERLPRFWASPTAALADA